MEVGEKCIKCSIMFCTSSYSKYSYGDHVKKNELGGTFGLYRVSIQGFGMEI